MAIAVQMDYTVDLCKPVHLIQMDVPFFTGDKNAHRFHVKLMRNGCAINVSGITATGYMVRADKQTVVWNGETDGCDIYLTMPASCYAVAGRFRLLLRVTLDDTIETALWVEGSVRESTTEVIVDPGTTLPSIEELIAQIAAMEQATEEARKAAAEADTVREGIQGDLATLSEKQSDTEAAVDAIDSPISTEYISGNITNGGTVNTSSTTRIRSAKPILITGGMRWSVSEPYRASVAIYNDAAFTSSNFAGFVGGSTSAMYSGDISIPAKYIGKYMGIRIEKYEHETENISGDLATISEYVKLHDISKVLSAGNHHPYTAEDFGQFLPIRRASSFDWEYGQFVMYDGREGPNAQAARTVLLEVSRYTTIVNRSPDLDHLGREFHVYVVEYDAEKQFIKRTRLYSGALLVTVENTAYVRLLAIYPSPLEIAMSGTNLLKNFSVGFVGNIAPGDGQRPVYVAFGASTTVGAVHHMDNKSVTYTHYAFPDYIGQILGLETYNFGNGTTGFMARDGGAKPNFMDAIYSNHDTLKDADLITLMFGYGNDKAAKLPFGEWDDYFPYDEVGAFFVSGETAANKAGITTMLSNGATLMGCLNWCIRYIGTNYPKATLVCIFGAPSGNGDYKVEVIANAAAGAGTTNVSSHKISVQGKKLDEETDMNVAVDTLRKMLNIPIINLFNDGLPFSYYSTMAMDESGKYAIFSTKGSQDSPEWNSHPNEAGYLMYARYIAGQVSRYFKH